MQLQFRIRTLMFVVGGAALVCAAIVELPGGVYLLIPLVPFIGPFVGAGWTIRRYQTGRRDPISGALLGGIVQATLISMVWSVFLLAPQAYLFLLLVAVHLSYGLVVGLIVTYSFLAFSSRDPLSSRIIQGGKRRGTDLRDLEPARAVDELEAWSKLFQEDAPHERDQTSATG